MIEPSICAKICSRQRLPPGLNDASLFHVCTLAGGCTCTLQQWPRGHARRTCGNTVEQPAKFAFQACIQQPQGWIG